jgi:hypothetical protein
MFSQLQDVQTGQLVQRGLIAFAVLALAPPAVLALSLLGVMLVPVAVVGIPFMLPAFFGGAVPEHDEVVRLSLRPPAHAAALA